MATTSNFDKVRELNVKAADAGKNANQVLLEFLRSADLATSIKVGAAFGLSEADVDRQNDQRVHFCGAEQNLHCLAKISGAGRCDHVHRIGDTGGWR